MESDTLELLCTPINGHIMRRLLPLAALLLALTSCTPKPRCIDFPTLESANINSVIIEKVSLTDSLTSLHIRAYHLPKWWITVSDKTELIADGQRYNIIGSEDITLGEKLHMPEDGDSLFVLHFEPLPLSTSQHPIKRRDALSVDCRPPGQVERTPDWKKGARS